LCKDNTVGINKRKDVIKEENDVMKWKLKTPGAATAYVGSDF
jgi:hypothetical protein